MIGFTTQLGHSLQVWDKDRHSAKIEALGPRAWTTEKNHVIPTAEPTFQLKVAHLLINEVGILSAHHWLTMSREGKKSSKIKPYPGPSAG